MSNELDSEKNSRSRSPAYPSIPLAEAVEATRKLWDAQRKQEARVDSVISALGYSSKNGTSLRLIAALKHYALVEETGANENRKLRISELAQDILHLPSEDERHRSALKVAALSPTIHATLWERYGVLLPGDAAIRPFLIRDKGYNDAIVDAVIKTYRSTFEYANLAKSDVANQDEKIASRQSPEPIRQPDERNYAISAGPIVEPQRPVASDTEQFLPILVGKGRQAQIPFPMTTEDFDLLIGTLNLWKKRIIQDPAPATNTSNFTHPMQVPQQPAPPKNSKLAIPFPLKAIWHNADHDQPVIVVDTFGEMNGEEWYKTDTNTGIPASQLDFTPAMESLPFQFDLTTGGHHDRLRD